MKLFLTALFVGILSLAASAAVPADSLGEGTCVGRMPIAADTVSDTSFHIGDTLVLSGGAISIKLPDSLKEEVVIPTIKSVVKIVVGDGFAHGTVEQVFVNPFDLPFDATYVFPLPNNGAIHDMEFRTSTGVYHADLMEKKKAQVIFDSANASGMQASLLTQVSDNVFVQNICNIPPKDSVKIKITYSSIIPNDMKKYDLNFPATIADDRFGDNPGHPIVSFPHERPGTSLEFYILMMTPYNITNLSCPTYDVTIDPIIPIQKAIDLGFLKEGEEFPENMSPSLVRLNSSNTMPNNDIVVRFSREESDRSISTLSYHDGTDGYLAMQIFPSLHDSGEAPLAIDMVFVIDKSGSMESGNMPNSPMKLARETVHRMLDLANENDRISLLAFSNSNSILFETPEAASDVNVSNAHTWIDQLQATGGTMMLAGVRKALETPLTDGKKRVIALVTDGEINDVDAIYEAIKNDASNTTVFAFAIGERTNQDLIDKAADAGNGIGKHIVNINDIGSTVSDFWKRIRMPQISDMSIDWGSDVPTNVVGSKFKHLWFGESIQLFGQYKTGGDRTVTLAGNTNGAAVSESYDINLVTDNTSMDAVSKMWARQIIKEWMNEQIALGNESNKNKILEISLAHNVLCKYTAFLAVADSIFDESINEWVSAEEWFINQSKKNNEINNDTGNQTTDLFTNKDLSKQKPTLLLNHFGNTIRMNLRGISENHNDGFITIYDLKGRIIRQWNIADLAKQNFSWIWDRTDKLGNPVSKGFYIISVRNSFFTMNIKLFVK